MSQTPRFPPDLKQPCAAAPGSGRTLTCGNGRAHAASPRRAGSSRQDRASSRFGKDVVARQRPQQAAPRGFVAGSREEKERIRLGPPLPHLPAPLGHSCHRDWEGGRGVSGTRPAETRRVCECRSPDPLPHSPLHLSRKERRPGREAGYRMMSERDSADEAGVQCWGFNRNPAFA